MKMKERLWTGWTTTRRLFFVIGLITMILGLLSKEWFFGAVGIYFALMGLFSFGCARGSCSINPSVQPSKKDH